MRPSQIKEVIKKIKINTVDRPIKRSLIIQNIRPPHAKSKHGPFIYLSSALASKKKKFKIQHSIFPIGSSNVTASSSDNL